MIETTAGQIQQLAAERGSPIGIPYEDSASEEPTGSSKRTVNRLIRGKTQDLLEELHGRLFYFVFAVLLYNIWRPIDFLLKAGVDGKRLRTCVYRG